MSIRARLKGIQSPASVATRMFYPGDKAPAPDFDPSAQPLEIHDARALQAGAPSAAACFEAHGFVLLDHRTASDAWGTDEAAKAERARIYHPEIDAIVRERLYPGRRVEIGQWLELVKRGGEEDAIYADWVHQDFGLRPDDFARNLAGILSAGHAERWLERYARDEVEGCVAISFWRTLGMQGPLRHMPLALCDPASVAMADVIEVGAACDGGGYHIALRYDAAQRWYSYPGVTGDELLAFKLFECRKDDPVPETLRSVFHSAFEDPEAPADAERRHSCEHRIWVMLLKD